MRGTTSANRRDATERKSSTNKRIPLSAELEAALLSAILHRQVPPDVVTPEELSKAGRVVHGAVQLLLKSGQPSLFQDEAIVLAATDVLGADRGFMVEYLRKIRAVEATTDSAEILRLVREKQLLVEVINEATKQLQGTLDLGTFGELFHRGGGTGALAPVSALLVDGFPPPPRGLAVASLPNLTAQTGGIYGTWVIGGEPKLGKSTLSWQIALDVARSLPVLYYDLENGFSVMMDHTASIFEGDLNAVREATTRVYYRDSIRSLDSDLAGVPPPGLVVVDSIQRLPASMEFRRSSLDRWLVRLDNLKRRGYSVLLISEVGRSQYGDDAYIGSYKETGEIEYIVDTGLQLLPYHDGVVSLHVVANRHRKFRGYLENLVRRRSWLWRESDAQPTPMENI